MIKFISTWVFVLFFTVIPNLALAVPEIPDPMLDDIAQARWSPSGPIIVFNPNICNATGLLSCRFFRAHEYAHVLYGDELGGTFPPFAEMRADCWAAQNANPLEVQAIIQTFLIKGNNGDPNHGTGYQRAQRVTDAFQIHHCHW